MAVLLMDIGVLVSAVQGVYGPQWTLTGIEALQGQLFPSLKIRVWSSLCVPETKNKQVLLTG